jgi:hypothetical protein
MKPQLALSLVSGRMLLDVVPPAPSRGIRSVLGALIPGRTAHLQSSSPQPTRPLSATYAGMEDMSLALEDLVAQLSAKPGQSMVGADLEAQLGLDHSYIGMMSLADVPATTLTSATLSSYARAWIAQMLHLDPATQIVRQRILNDPRKVLISCVDRAVFEVLQNFSLQHKLRFRSCRPAVLSIVTAEQEAGQGATDQSGRTVVWTELDANGHRTNRVQLVRLVGKELAAAWRGWVPAPEGDAADAQLEAAVRRFEACYSDDSGHVRAHLRWPLAAAAAPSGLTK